MLRGGGRASRQREPQHQGPEIETGEKAGGARAQRVGVRAEKAEVSRGLIPVHWSEASALGLAQSRCPVLAIVIVTSAKCGEGGKPAEKIPGLEELSFESSVLYPLRELLGKSL